MRVGHRGVLEAMADNDGVQIQLCWPWLRLTLPSCIFSPCAPDAVPMRPLSTAPGTCQREAGENQSWTTHMVPGLGLTVTSASTACNRIGQPTNTPHGCNSNGWPTHGSGGVLACMGQNGSSLTPSEPRANGMGQTPRQHEPHASHGIPHTSPTRAWSPMTDSADNVQA